MQASPHGMIQCGQTSSIPEPVRDGSRAADPGTRKRIERHMRDGEHSFRSIVSCGSGPCRGRIAHHGAQLFGAPLEVWRPRCVARQRSYPRTCPHQRQDKAPRVGLDPSRVASDGHSSRSSSESCFTFDPPHEPAHVTWTKVSPTSRSRRGSCARLSASRRSSKVFGIPSSVPLVSLGDPVELEVCHGQRVSHYEAGATVGDEEPLEETGPSRESLFHQDPLRIAFAAASFPSGYLRLSRMAALRNPMQRP